MADKSRFYYCRPCFDSWLAMVESGAVSGSDYADGWNLDSVWRNLFCRNLRFEKIKRKVEFPRHQRRNSSLAILFGRSQENKEGKMAKVFLTEDDAYQRGIIRGFLETGGHEVLLETGDFNEALGIVKRVRELGIDLAILDGSLRPQSPNDGAEIAAVLRKEAPE